VTLQSIADQLGVSRSTVSNAYNRADHVSEGLRAEIFRVAKDLGYAGPNPIARKLRTGQQLAVGLLFTDSLSFAIRDPAAVRFLEGLTLACESAGVALLLVPALDGGPQNLTMVGQAAVDGFVVYSMPEASPHLDAALRRKLPLVVVDEPDGLDEADWVGLDDEASFRQLGQHLLEIGHRNIGIVCSKLSSVGYNGPASIDRLLQATYSVQHNRINGLHSAMRAILVPHENMPIEERRDNNVVSGFDAGNAILDRRPDLTAIVCTTDVLALGVLQAARERGIAVPEQLSVCGHDDIPEAAAAGLTTVQQPLVEKGRVAGHLLLTYGDRKAPRRHVLPTQIRMRRTTGRAPSR